MHDRDARAGDGGAGIARVQAGSRRSSSSARNPAAVVLEAVPREDGAIPRERVADARGDRPRVVRVEPVVRSCPPGVRRARVPAGRPRRAGARCGSSSRAPPGCLVESACHRTIRAPAGATARGSSPSLHRRPPQLDHHAVTQLEGARVAAPCTTAQQLHGHTPASTAQPPFATFQSISPNFGRPGRPRPHHRTRNRRNTPVTHTTTAPRQQRRRRGLRPAVAPTSTFVVRGSGPLQACARHINGPSTTLIRTHTPGPRPDTTSRLHTPNQTLK